MADVLKVFAAAVLVVVSLSWFEVSAQTHHVVGGDKGWGPDLDVTSWLSGRVFSIGDKIWFKNSGTEDNVVELQSLEEFLSCNLTNPIRMYTDLVNHVVLDKGGVRYFTSGNPERCKNGLKLPVSIRPATAFEPPFSHYPPPSVDPYEPVTPTPPFPHYPPPTTHYPPPSVDPYEPVTPPPFPHYPPPPTHYPPPSVDPYEPVTPTPPFPHPPPFPHYPPPSDEPYEPVTPTPPFPRYPPPSDEPDEPVTPSPPFSHPPPFDPYTPVKPTPPFEPPIPVRRPPPPPRFEPPPPSAARRLHGWSFVSSIVALLICNIGT